MSEEAVVEDGIPLSKASALLLLGTFFVLKKKVKKEKKKIKEKNKEKKEKVREEKKKS